MGVGLLGRRAKPPQRCRCGFRALSDEFGLVRPGTVDAIPVPRRGVKQPVVLRVGDHRVTQYHFDRWPAHTCPSPSALLQFVRRLSAGLAEMRADGEDSVPVVHCGDGGGRSGAFIVIMENLRMIEERGEVN